MQRNVYAGETQKITWSRALADAELSFSMSGTLLLPDCRCSFDTPRSAPGWPFSSRHLPVINCEPQTTPGVFACCYRSAKNIADTRLKWSLMAGATMYPRAPSTQGFQFFPAQE